MSCRETMFLQCPEKQRSCKIFGFSIDVSRGIISLRYISTRATDRNKAHGSEAVPIVKAWVWEIRTRCLRPILQVYYPSQPTLPEESCFLLDLRHVQERVGEPFGGEAKLMPQSRSHSRQRLHLLLRYRSQYGLREPGLETARRGPENWVQRAIALRNTRIHCGGFPLVFLRHVP